MFLAQEGTGAVLVSLGLEAWGQGLLSESPSAAVLQGLFPATECLLEHRDPEVQVQCPHLCDIRLSHPPGSLHGGALSQASAHVRVCVCV